MDFRLNEKQALVQKMIRDFTEKEVAPIAHEIDEEERFPVETVRELGKIGALGIPFPAAYGGAGGDNLSYVLCVEELGKKCGSHAVIVSAHTSLAGWPIEEFGTEEQKEKYLRPLATGEKIGAFGLTEPNAGTDSAMQQTFAQDKEDHFLLNGSKIFITNGGAADIYIVFAMTDRTKGTRGISAFILEKEMEGFTIGKQELKMGIRASSTTELIFRNVRVPKENLLGEVGKGFKIAMQTLDGGRIGIAAQALGIAQGAIDETLEYVSQRKQFGRTLAKFQNTQFQLADMQTRVDAARLLVYRAAVLKDQGASYSTEAAMAKLFASETAMDVTTRAVQLFGGYGYTREYPVERLMRDAKITEIYEGTSEVQRMVISGSLLR